jgi:exoribonuclease-2
VLRLVEIPLVIRLAGMPPVARGAQVRLDIIRWDEVDLSLEARLLEVSGVAPEADIALDEEEGDTGQAAVEEVVEAEGLVAAVEPQEVTAQPEQEATK